MYNILIEICSFSFEGCYNAYIGGADRIELCSSPQEGGTTPSYGLVKHVKNNLDIALTPIVRPRAGNFVYTTDEIITMQNDIELFKDLGCEGVSFGVLTTDGKIDLKAMKDLIHIAKPMDITCIRAIDLVSDVFRSLDELIDIGCDRVLTSGLANKAENALPLLKRMVDYVNDKISIMPGSGINPDNIMNILHHTGAKEIHASLRKERKETARKSELRLGFGTAVTNDLDKIKQLRAKINNKK
jgi:copper homeostasis protein